MERNPTAEQLEHAGEQRRIYRVERKFGSTRTAMEMVRNLVQAHS